MVGNYDLSGCLVDFTSAPAGVKLTDHFPELSAFEEFVNTVDDNEIRVAIAISDIESPFLKIKENEMRLKALFDFLGIGLKTMKNREFFDEVLNYRHKRVIAACCRHIQRQNNHAFASWWSLNMAFYDLQKESTKPRDKDQDVLKYVNGKAMLAKEMDAIASKLADYEARIFRDTKMKQAIVDMELQKIVTYPEMFAEKHQGY